MARGRASAGPEISLFPFLSILACLIGSLTILIVALSVSEVLQGRKDETVARAEDFVALEKEVRERDEEIAKREEELRKTNAAAVDMAELEPRVAKVKADTGSDRIRVIKPGMMVTMDYREDRVNLDVDKDNQVLTVRCG